MKRAFRITETQNGFRLEGIGFDAIIAPASGGWDKEVQAYNAARQLGHITPDIDL